MSIESPRIAGQPALQRWQVLDQPVLIRSVNPGETFSYLDPVTGEVFRDVTFDPEFEGQVYFNVATSGADRTAFMYVAVNIDGTLVWKGILSETFISGFTGKGFDPMYD